MKFYKVEISGKLISRIFKEGITSDFGERVTVKQGIPQDAKLIMTRMQTVDNLELLYATDEEGEYPEAVDIWYAAEHVLVGVEYSWDDSRERVTA